MAEDDEEAAEPTVELGAGEPVEGAPIARIAERLMWGMEKSAIIERAGDTEIRTPDGPRDLADILETVDQTYFSTRQDFLAAVREEIGDGPVPTTAE